MSWSYGSRSYLYGENERPGVLGRSSFRRVGRSLHGPGITVHVNICMAGMNDLAY